MPSKLAKVSDVVQRVATIADLREISVAALASNSVVEILGYYVKGDGGGGTFYYDPSSAATDNGGTIIQPTIGSGRWVRVFSGSLNVRWFGAKGDDTANDTASIRAAITHVSSVGGGEVFFPSGRYFITGLTPNSNYISDSGVSLRGEKMPSLSSNADRLENGAVIVNRFYVYANNFSIDEIGFDLGKYAMDTHYNAYDSLTANHPDGGGGNWDAFAFAQPNSGAPISTRKSFRARNVITLLSRSASYGHSFLLENADGGFLDNIIGVYGLHACAIKAQNIKGTSVAGWMGSTNCVILKSDVTSGAACGYIDLSSVTALKSAPNCTPWSAPSTPVSGVILEATTSFTGPIRIGSVRAYGQNNGLIITGGASSLADDLQFGSVYLDGTGGAMVNALAFTACRARRIKFSDVIINNVGSGLIWASATSGDLAEHQVTIGSCQISNASVRAVTSSLYSRIRISCLEMKNCATGYYIDDNSRVLIGHEKLMTVTEKWGRSAPTINANWANVGGGNSTFDVLLKNYGVELSGLVVAGATPSGTVCSMPIYLRPSTVKRYPSYRNNGTRLFAMILVDSSGAGVLLDDGTDPAVADYISIEGVNWDI